MQGMKNTIPNFNLNENLNFSMMQGNNQQLMNNRNNQRGFYNQQNFLINGNIMNNNLPSSSKTMRNEKIMNSFQQKDSKYGNILQNKKNQKQFNNNNNNMNNNMNLMPQDLKNNNNTNDNRYMFKQQNPKNIKNNMYDPSLYQQTEEQQGMNTNNQNMNNNYLGNYTKNKINEGMKNNTSSLILKLRVDNDKYENVEINLDEDPYVFYQSLEKKVNLNKNIMVFLYKKIKNIMDKIKKIFDEPLNQESFNDLNTISNILTNKDSKSKDCKSINGIKLMIFDKKYLLRNFSFNSLKSNDHKKFVDKLLFSSEESKINKKMNKSP